MTRYSYVLVVMKVLGGLYLLWLSIITLALSNDAQRADALPILAGCLMIGSVVFCAYALLFSTQSARRIHARSRRCFDGILAAAFGVAGVRMLLSR